jgi:hypothetical protein
MRYFFQKKKVILFFWGDMVGKRSEMGGRGEKYIFNKCYRIEMDIAAQ